MGQEKKTLATPEGMSPLIATTVLVRHTTGDRQSVEVTFKSIPEDPARAIMSGIRELSRLAHKYGVAEQALCEFRAEGP